jgi:hypothetical protein
VAKTPDRVPQDRFELYETLIATQPDIELKGGMKLPHTSTNGYMFSSLTKDGRVGLRLSNPDREAFMERYDAVPFRNYGAAIKEHVEVPEGLLRNPEELGPYLAMSYAYTQTLPPKKGKRKAT